MGGVGASVAVLGDDGDRDEGDDDGGRGEERKDPPAGPPVDGGDEAGESRDGPTGGDPGQAPAQHGDDENHPDAGDGDEDQLHEVVEPAADVAGCDRVGETPGLELDRGPHGRKDAGSEDPEEHGVEGQDGHGQGHPDADGGAGPGLEERQAAAGRRVVTAEEAGERRADEGEEVGDADQVAHHVVAVHADEGEELVQHLHLRDGDEDEQRGEVGGLIDASGDEDGDDVEVQAPEIGAQPAPAVQAVGVGDVGVEDGEHQIDADAHDARPGAAVPGRRCVADLVEGAHRDADGDHREQKVGLQDGLLYAAQDAGALGGDEPDVEGDEGGEGGDDERCPEQGLKRPGDAPVQAFGYDPGPEPQSEQQRTGLAQVVGGRGGTDDAERGELVVDQVVDVVDADRPAEGGADQGGDVGDAPDSVEEGEHQIEQAGQLDDLPVGAAHQVLGLVEGGGLVLAEQLGARGQAKRNGRPVGIHMQFSGFQRCGHRNTPGWKMAGGVALGHTSRHGTNWTGTRLRGRCPRRDGPKWRCWGSRGCSRGCSKGCT